MDTNEIYDPMTNNKFSIFSPQGKNILRNYIFTYKKMEVYMIR